MARYDRIASLRAPGRERAFPGWLVLRDLQQRERDADLSRRVRLRFMAIRPVLRLVERGIDAVPPQSLERQLEAVREELGVLAARDPERARLANYLHLVRVRTPATLAAATHDMGDMAAALRHDGAAEEFLRASIRIAEQHRLTRAAVTASIRLATLRAERGDVEQAETELRRAASLAEAGDDRLGFARAMRGIADLLLARGDAAGAAEIATSLRGLLDDSECGGIADQVFAAYHLATGSFEAAVEAGWAALERAAEAPERSAALAVLRSAFARSGMLEAADRCDDLIVRGATDPRSLEDEAIGRVTTAARAGRRDDYQQRRAALLTRAAEIRRDPITVAFMHLELGRGSLLVGDASQTREHLREAMALMKRDPRPRAAALASTLLDQLESAAGVEISMPDAPSAGSARIAAAVAGYQEVETVDA